MKRQIIFPLVISLVLIGITLFNIPAVGHTHVADAVKDDPETVVDTLHVKAGKEEELARVMKQAWATYRKFGMVLPKPHLLMRGVDNGGRPFFVEILTWKSHEAPDNAPPEVTKIWAQMEALCEKRDGRRGIEFYEVHSVQ